MRRREFLTSAGAVMGATAALRPSFGTMGMLHGAVSVPLHMVGVNALNPVTYYDPVFPYLNLLKHAGSNTFWEPWYTRDSSTAETNEEAYLQLDSDLNVTSLTASPTPPGGQRFTYVETFIFRTSQGNGATYVYPPGPYTLKVDGPGTFNLAGDVDTTSVSSSSPNISITGGQVVSTQAQGTVATIIFNVATQTINGGIHIQITALPGPSYLKFLSCVQSTYQSLYDAGVITSPLFKATILGSGFHGYNGPIRFMQGLNTYNQDWLLKFTADLASGATAGNLSIVGATDYYFGAGTVVGAGAITGGSGYTNGTYTGVSLTGGSGSGAKATITVSGGAVTGVTITAAGSGYYDGDALSAAASSIGGTGSGFSVPAIVQVNWPLPSGTYKAVFSTGQVIAFTASYGSPTINWATALSGAITRANIGAMAVMAAQGSWASRPLMSNFAWGTHKGMPLEVAIQMCNELGLNPWLHVPGASALTDTTWSTNLAKLMQNGTGANIAGSNLSSFTGVSASLIPKVEYSNEVWNGIYHVFNLATMMGNQMGFYAAQGNNQYAAGREFTGVQLAGICDAFSSVYGAGWQSKVEVVFMDQFTPGAVVYVKAALNTPDWTSRAYTHGIAAIGVAPYFGTDGINATDAAAIKAASNPVNTLYSLAWSGSSSYTSTPIASGGLGWIGYYVDQMSQWVTAIKATGYTWATLPIYCYEGGDALDDALAIENSVPGWRVNVLLAAQRDSRMAQAYYDPSHTLSATYSGYLEELRKLGVSFICQLSGTGPPVSAGMSPGSAGWGALENTMQTISPLSSAPSKYQGIMDFINHIPS
ncbi:MAG: hypothetical protein KGL39_08705 [Patescibacteria group bacterium]|nr:hypothetical protein [Patescibacteria group bacterium]